MEGSGLTPGIKNAMARGDVHSLCKCGFPLPKYPGRYPKNCPHCGETRAVKEAADREDDDGIEDEDEFA